ncbi:MAG: sensor histidine kinase [Spirulina sp.]
MTRPSLRWRLALLSSALAGGVLLGFALLSGWLIYQAKLDRLDAQLISGLQPLGRPRNGDPLANPEMALAQTLGLAEPEAVALVIFDRNHSLRYQSPWWPENLALPNSLRPDIHPSPASPSLDAPRPSLPAPPATQPRRGMDRAMPLEVVTLGPITARGSGQRWRVVGRSGPLGRVVIAVSLQAIHQEMGALGRIYGLTIPGALALVAVGSWALAGRALQPVQTLSQAIAQVTAQGLHQRIVNAEVDQEFEPLITAFNAMLERLERSFHQATRFSGDAAHELKTPLAILQGELEQALQQAEAGSPIQQTLGRLLDEVSRLGGIVRKLLLLSLADAGQMTLHQAPVNLSQLVADQLEDLALLAPDLTVTAELPPNLWVNGDSDLLIQVIQNLLGNAIKYNLPQGWIRVVGEVHQGQSQITITNAAQPLSAQDRQHLFDRFYRGDPARSRTTDGLGLGLSLAREIARAHGGDLTLATPHPSPQEPSAVGLRLCLPYAQAQT